MPSSVHKPVLLIRADGNQDDADALAEVGLETLIEPYIRIDKSTDAADANRLLDALKAAGPKWLIATSVNAIKCFGELVGLETLKAAISEAGDLKFAAVGARTAASLRALGAAEVLTPELADSTALAKALVSLEEGDQSPSSLTGRPQTAIIPSGLLAMKGLPNKLEAAGWGLIQGVVYTTVTVAAPPTSVAAANAGDFSAVIFRSPSAARAFLSFVAKPAMPLVAAGFTTAKVIEDAGLVVASIPSNPTPKSVAAAVKSLLEGDR
jgi:uroporphyrinogen-III synthase